MKYLTSIFSSLLIVGSLFSQHCGYNYNYNYYTPYYVKEFYVPITYPVPVFIDPRLSYQYLGGNMPQKQEPDIDKLIEKLELRANKSKVYEPDDRLPVPGFKKVSGSLLSSYCAKCHTKGSEKGDFVMFTNQGSLINFDRKVAYDAVKRGSMPYKMQIDASVRQSLELLLQ